jgi:preprotein translocase subunit YajC
MALRTWRPQVSIQSRQTLPIQRPAVNCGREAGADSPRLRRVKSDARFARLLAGKTSEEYCRGACAGTALAAPFPRDGAGVSFSVYGERRNTAVNVGILFIYVVLVIGVFYFLMVRPQRRRRRAQQELLGAVKKGDEIVTADGLFGTVRQVRDTFVVLEIADRKKVRLLKSAVSQVLVAQKSPTKRG